ncbi:MAG: purine-nucleoside phosphorylase [Bdellovibrio sp.]
MSEMIEKAKNKILSINKDRPRVGIILGSGLGPVVDAIENPIKLEYTDIPGFKNTTVEGHSGSLIRGKIKNTEVVVMQGRVHFYEGHSLEDVVFPARVLASLGLDALVITNASGGINSAYHPGEIVMIKDHINLTGRNPLVGPNNPNWGPRFPDMTYAYNPEYRELMKKVAAENKIKLQEGVYVGVSGPTYETPAEINMFRIVGADMVGMSTVPEVIAAHHMGAKILALSCVSNMAAGMTAEKLDHSDIKDVALLGLKTMTTLLTGFIEAIGKQK